MRKKPVNQKEWLFVDWHYPKFSNARVNGFGNENGNADEKNLLDYTELLHAPYLGAVAVPQEQYASTLLRLEENSRKEGHLAVFATGYHQHNLGRTGIGICYRSYTDWNEYVIRSLVHRNRPKSEGRAMYTNINDNREAGIAAIVSALSSVSSLFKLSAKNSNYTTNVHSKSTNNAEIVSAPPVDVIDLPPHPNLHSATLPNNLKKGLFRSIDCGYAGPGLEHEAKYHSLTIYCNSRAAIEEIRDYHANWRKDITIPSYTNNIASIKFLTWILLHQGAKVTLQWVPVYHHPESSELAALAFELAIAALNEPENAETWGAPYGREYLDHHRRENSKGKSSGDPDEDPSDLEIAPEDPPTEDFLTMEEIQERYHAHPWNRSESAKKRSAPENQTSAANEHPKFIFRNSELLLDVNIPTSPEDEEASVGRKLAAAKAAAAAANRNKSAEEAAASKINESAEDTTSEADSPDLLLRSPPRRKTKKNLGPTEIEPLLVEVKSALRNRSTEEASASKRGKSAEETSGVMGSKVTKKSSSGKSTRSGRTTKKGPSA